MIEPYYQDDAVTIYLGDCREIVPNLPKCAAVITDPPYNVGVNYGRGASADRRSALDHDEDLAVVLAACPAPEIVWFPGKVNVFRAGAVCERAGLRAHWMLGWFRKEFAGDRFWGGPAMCWEPIVWASRRESPEFQKRFGHMGRDFLVVRSTHGCTIDHPCPKPIRVMEWLVGLFSQEGDVVLDPFAGSGTTGVAAKELGRRAVLIEIEEKYCEVAARRLEQEVLPLATTNS